MRIRRLVLLASVLALTVVGSGSSVARESLGSLAARTAFDRGEAAVRAGELDAAVAAFRKAIAADPAYVDAHQRLIEITQRQQLQDPEAARLPRLQRQYQRWARQQPKRAVYQVALGLLAKEPEQAAAYYNKALALDPAFAHAHFLLARIADNAGEWDAQRQHLNAAVESNRDEPRYLLRYAIAHEKSDPVRFRELAMRVVSTFPTSPSAAEALYTLANASTNPERRGYLDRLRAGYPVDRFPYAASAMNTLYADLTEPSEARALARDMIRALPAATVWPPRVVAQDAMIRAKTLIDGGKSKEAVALLDTTAKPSGNHGTTWTLLKAEAAAGIGNQPQAYETLIESAAASPDGRVDAALATYATALGKSNRDVDADVWNTRDARARPAAPFTLPSLPDGAAVRLADFRGRVVLLAFWYPT